MNKIPEPLNTNERYLHAIAIRLDALCNMMSSFLEAYANQHNIATTNHTIDEKIASKPRPKRSSKTSTK